jgi:integrase
VVGGWAAFGVPPATSGVLDEVLAEAQQRRRDLERARVELQKVPGHIDGDRYAIAWQLALTGLRRGELAGLRWSDIGLDAQ